MEQKKYFKMNCTQATPHRLLQTSIREEYTGKLIATVIKAKEKEKICWYLLNGNKISGYLFFSFAL